MAEPYFDDWRSGRKVDRCCLKKVVCAAGLASYSGDAEPRFAQVHRYLQRTAGFDEGDFLEATCAGSLVEGRWQPRPYHVSDIQGRIADSVEAIAREMEWYRERLPATRFYLLGYSLGGVLMLEAAGRLLSRDLSGWRGRLAGVGLFSAPILGVDFGVLGRVARDLAERPDFYGRAGVELVERARAPETVSDQESLVALLRANGVRLLFVVDRNDAVVQPRDATLPSARARREVVSVSGSATKDSDAIARRFGHGPVLADPTTPKAVARLVGRQECLGSHAYSATGEEEGGADDAVEAELRALKEELRRRRGG